MLRIVLAFVAGFFIAGTLAGLVQRFGLAVYPLPDDWGASTPNGAASAPLPTLIAVTAAWLAGTCGGNFTAQRIARDRARFSVILVSGLMLATGLIKLLEIRATTGPITALVLGIALMTVIPLRKQTRPRSIETNQSTEDQTP